MRAAGPGPGIEAKAIAAGAEAADAKRATARRERAATDAADPLPAAQHDAAHARTPGHSNDSNDAEAGTAHPHQPEPQIGHLVRPDVQGLVYRTSGPGGGETRQRRLERGHERRRVPHVDQRRPRHRPQLPVQARVGSSDAARQLTRHLRARRDPVRRPRQHPRPADPVGLGLPQHLQNLVGNALKFRAAAPPLVEVSAERDSEEWVVTVRDNGPGVDTDQATRIFGIFARGNARAEGTGIGLAVCRRVVEAHGGRIWVEAAEGGGSAFRFTLPH